MHIIWKLCAFIHASKVAWSSISKKNYFQIRFCWLCSDWFYHKQMVSVTKSQIINLGKYALVTLLLWSVFCTCHSKCQRRGYCIHHSRRQTWHRMVEKYPYTSRCSLQVYAVRKVQKLMLYIEGNEAQGKTAGGGCYTQRAHGLLSRRGVPREIYLRPFLSTFYLSCKVVNARSAS